MFHLETLTPGERTKLAAVLRRKLVARAVLFIVAILVSIGVVVYFTAFRKDIMSEDNIGIINVVFIVLIMFCARLLYAEISDYSKETRAVEKKVTRTRVGARDGNKIQLGNKTFSKEEILVDNSAFDSLQAGDEVILEISTRSSLIFTVKKA